MKLFYLCIPIILFFLIGCSSTYKVTDYPSIEKFHEEVNSSIKNKNFNIVTIDSSFTSLAGSIIIDDSLKMVTKVQEEKIPLKNVKKIKYFGNAYKEPSAYVWLKNGKELRAENIKKLPDSMIQLTNLRINSGYIPIDKVKEISYKNKWSGAIIGIPMGSVSGAVIGGMLGSAGVIFHINSGGNENTFDKGQSSAVGVVAGALIGAVTGAIIGYIVGWDNIYEFNP